MGGGDLNLKKSWHPQTLHNIEKVWKAEQKAEAESKKIEQLQRELAEERQREEMQRYAVDQGIARKKSDRLEWMYSAPGHAGVNREEYLLGKSIDKAVDPLATNEEKNAEAPGASFMEDSPSAGNDLAAKIRDDPLFMIKKKENEKKKELLKNPVRMKQLQQMLKADLEKKGRKNKKDKKRKKEKRQKHSSDEDRKNKHGSKSSSSRRKVASDSDSSEGRNQHLNGASSRRNKRNEHLRRSYEHDRDNRISSDCNLVRNKENRKRKTSSSSPELGLQPRSSKKINKNMNSPVRRPVKHNRSSPSRSSSPRSRRRSSSPKQRQRQRQEVSRSRRHHSSETEERRREEPAFNNRSRDGKNRSPKGRRHQNIPTRSRSRSRSPIKYTLTGTSTGSTSRSYGVKKQSESTASRKLTDEERERRLAEMMSNAKWRDEQRDKNVKRYKEEDEAEAKQAAQNTDKGASFVQPMKVQTFTSSNASVENRIKRNINSLQRTPAAMEKFLRK